LSDATRSESTTSERWPRYQEPVVETLVRNVALALIIGGVVAWRVGRLSLWPAAAALALWFTLGGHLIEVWFLNSLRHRIPRERATQIAARVVLWFVAGVVLAQCVLATMRVVGMVQNVTFRRWWLPGLVFVLVELVAHLALVARRRPNFYDGAG
jgi:hypothetical protein